MSTVRFFVLCRSLGVEPSEIPSAMENAVRSRAALSARPACTSESLGHGAGDPMKLIYVALQTLARSRGFITL